MNMKTAESVLVGDTIHFRPDIPVKQTLNVPITGLKTIPDLPPRPQKAKLTPQQEYFRYLTIERNKKWREEQSLLIDTSRYIWTRSDIALIQKDYKAYDIKLPSKSIDPVYNDWFILSFFMTLILLSIVRRSFFKYLVSLFRGILNYPVANRMFREQNASARQGTVLMELFFLVIFSLFGYQCIDYFGLLPDVSNILRFIIVLLAVSLYFIIKTNIYRFIAFIYETQTETGEYLFHMKNYNKVLGVFLLPVVGLTAWSPFQNITVFLISGVVFIAVLYLLTLRRGIKIILKKQFSIFYLFLYLCTLEILPMLLFLKVVS